MKKPVILYSTLYPATAGDLNELQNTAKIVSEFLESELDMTLKVHIGSCHKKPLETIEKLLTNVDVELTTSFYSTHYAGTRAEEISHGKEQLAMEWEARTDYDYVWFMDSDMWTSPSRIPVWIDMLKGVKDKKFLKLPYCLRDRLESHSIALGAFFHHRKLNKKYPYAKHVFPKRNNGKRKGAPDCNIQHYFKNMHVGKLADNELLMTHYTAKSSYNRYFNGRCSKHKVLQPSLPMDPEVSGMSIEPQACEIIAGICRSYNLQSGIDIGFGKGNSTYAMHCGGVGHITAVDGDEKWLKLGVKEAPILFPKLTLVPKFCPTGKTGYDLGPPFDFQMAVIDGPPKNDDARIATALKLKATHYIFNDAKRAYDKIMEFAGRVRPAEIKYFDTERGLIWIRTYER